ncbi:MAG: hypothetical protein CMG66_00415 [Candidatus Marinimicrobia bacterium]|nr:hypothetical protein [Candidatus Neomarinimicrobiota bacterium]|tara:strand:- start:2152 stop:3117 length:966 start_codon:yes stop_codon:yes gene_type:complete
MLKKFLKNHPIHKKIVPYLDTFFIYNPTLFFAVWVMICIGMYIFHSDTLLYPQWLTSVINFKTICLFISLTFLTGALFIKQQIIIYELDKIRNERSPLHIFISKDKAVNIINVSLAISFFTVLLTNIYNLFLSILLFFILNFYINKKYTLLKIYQQYFLLFFISVLLIFNGYVIAFSDKSYFFSLFNIFNIDFFLKIFFYALAVLPIFIMMQILEFTNRFILRFFSCLIMLIVFICSFIFNNPFLSISSICSLPFLLYALFRNLNKDLSRSVKYPLFVFNFFISTIYPYMFIPLILIFYISKYYYWHRFDIHFPTFLVEND